MVQWEYKLGQLTINLRVLMEPKGFLRIILFVIALLSFSLTAGFNVSVNSSPNRIACTSIQTDSPNVTALLGFGYPFTLDTFVTQIIPSNDANFTRNTSLCVRTGPSIQAYSSSAQFFVAMGVFTMIYVGGALFVYMLFINPDFYLAKWIVIGDLFGTILFGVLYLIASLAWSVGAAQLHQFVRSFLSDYGSTCLMCDTAFPVSRSTVQFSQPAISALLGWVCAFIWLSTVWYVYKDTMWHKDETGPLAQLYAIKNKKSEGGEGGENGEKDPKPEPESEQEEQ